MANKTEEELKQMFYSVQIKSNGEELSRWKTREEAEAEVQRQEELDTEDGQYENDHYCIEGKSIYHVVVLQFVLPWKYAHKIKDFRMFKEKYFIRHITVPEILEETFNTLDAARASFELHKKSLKRREVNYGDRHCISWDSIELSEENDEYTTDNIDFACAEYRED